jgi:alpha-galactosidase
MAVLVELAGHSFAVQLSGTGTPEPVAGGLLLPAGRVAVLHGLGDAEFYRHGHNSWSPCGWRRLSEPPLRIADPRRRLTADDTVWDDPHRHHSSALAALRTGDGRVLLLGALGLDVPRLAADRDTLSGWYERDGAPWFLAYGDEDDVFAAYTAQLADRLGARNRKAGNVWCSWYAYYETVNETQLAKDISALAGLPFDVVQIDDGWETCVGDWWPNEKFPAGMRGLADRIRDVGMVPGLWLAPFIALPNSELATRRPELLLCDTRGEPVVTGYNWDTGYYALDLTRADTRDHLAELIDRVVHQWGFRYLKIDFVNAALAPARRPDGTGREQVYRDALALVREVAGDDVYLLGSGAPLLPSLGLLDGIRSGPDVAPIWQNYASDDPSDAMARNAVVNAVHRLWQAPLIEVDPDIIYFRSRLNLLTDQQTGWLRDLADICGFRAVSDPPGWLTPDELDTMTRYLSRRPQVRRLGRYRFGLDGREVDFGPVIAPDQGQRYPIS